MIRKILRTLVAIPIAVVVAVVGKLLMPNPDGLKSMFSEPTVIDAAENHATVEGASVPSGMIYSRNWCSDTDG